MAVDNSFGGPHSREKAVWLQEAVCQFFRDNGQSACPVHMHVHAFQTDRLEGEDVEDFLAEVLNREFDLILEDGSLCSVCPLQVCVCVCVCERASRVGVA